MISDLYASPEDTGPYTMQDQPEYKIARSFTTYHQRLLDIAFGRSIVQQMKDIDFSCLNSQDITTLANMAEVEFAASLQKEIENPGDDIKGKPHAFDIFIMDQSLDRRNSSLAVCLPVQVNRTSMLVWHDAEGNFWPLEPRSHVRRVSSLSGVARILESLSADPFPKLMLNAMQRKNLVSVVDMDQSELDAIANTDEMNESQKLAVATVANTHFDEGFFVIQGPPGCGKTTTMVGMISAVGQGVIVSAPSNAAVANVALKLHSKGWFDLRDICVYGQNCDECVQFLNPVHRSAKFQVFCKDYSQAKDAQGKYLVKRKFAKWMHLNDDCSVEVLATMCPFIDMDDREGRDLLTTIVSSSSVVMCTLNTAGTSFLRNAARRRFHTLLLDEGGQCPEAEFYIATTFPGVRRIVVVGDPKQLPATVIDPTVQRAGYGESWMSRVAAAYPQNIHLLDTQYRMDPEILKFPNASFYSGRIQSGENVFGRKPYVEFPFRFIDTAKRGQEEKDKYSFKNSYEAAVIKSILTSDSDILRVRKSDPRCRIIVISPYKGQVDLLESMISDMKGAGSVSIATVDSFQGQEAPVVIVSTVRTKSVGFVDSAQRLNVALTRAKRVLRVVGDLQFFVSLGPRSTLKSLAIHVEDNKSIERSKLKMLAWAAPDWQRPTLWKPTMTKRFHHCLKPMNERDKNISFNTLLALCTPNLQEIDTPPIVRPIACWQMSALKGHRDSLSIVWVATKGRQPTVQAHFVGTRRQCLRFIQTQRKLPQGTCIVHRDMSGIVENSGETTTTPIVPSGQAFIAWHVTNGLQSAVKCGAIDSLPQGGFCLDPQQEEISRCVPPLLIESRSGTGKTNVLFHHAVSHARVFEADSSLIKPILFVTVSPRLKKELTQRFEEIKRVEDVNLPQIMFLSLNELLLGLLHMANMKDVSLWNGSAFLDYVNARKSHSCLAVEPSLVENEIGGVIVGSLRAAQAGRALTRTEYLSDKRSNVDNKTEQGCQLREKVYDEYELFARWKWGQGGLLDINDVVLRLLEADMDQIFQSVYLDEVQDFTYASIFLICKIGGSESLSWIFAGDTAQMISPGCSFRFAGLKETLLAVREGIEAKLSNVCNLLVNYRTTRDVLILGNSILSVAKEHFPGAIEYAQPEIATKDEATKVRLTDWDEAFKTKVAFGPNQALIYSCGNSDNVKDAAVSWVEGHPFVLSSLESKGLEFDDVVIAFDMDRKVWNVPSKRVACLRMLRELYVAVTRAKRRVVILIKKSLPAMSDFFESLGCDLEHVRASTAFLEFDTRTSPEAWLKKGHEFFEDEKYDLAAGCFHAARSDSWSFWAQGLHSKRHGNKDDALSSFRLAARAFLDQSEYKYTLDMMVLIRALPPWSPEDTAVYDEARRHLPEHFPRVEIVHFALVQDRWNALTVEDMVTPSTATLLIAYRKHDALKNIIKQCTEADLLAISALLPTIVGDCYYTSGRFSDAVKLYLKGNDHENAEKATEEQLSVKGNNVDDAILKCVSYWEDIPKRKRKLTSSSVTLLLLQLFESPASIAATSASKCLTSLGADIIVLAIRRGANDETLLHDFHQTVFQKEVLAALETKHKENLFEIVRWYTGRDDLANATDYANKNMKTWSDEELTAVVLELKLHPGGLIREFERRDKLVAAVDLFLRGGHEYLSSAIMASDMALSSPAKAVRCGDELLIVWRNAKGAETAKALAESKASKISAFLHLFDHPSEASRTRANECLKHFGKMVVQKAVISSRIYNKEEIKSALARFHKSFNSLSSADLIKLFHDVGGGRARVQEFVHANLNEWTNEELSDIVRNETSVRSPVIAKELARRRLFLLCMEIALGERNIPEAHSQADCELSVRTWAAVMPTFTLWRRFIKPGDSMETLVLAGPSRFSALLRLREDALSIMRSDQAVRTVASFGPSFVGYAIRFNGVPDDFAAFADIKLFHETLRGCICEKLAAQRMKRAAKKKPPKPSIPQREAKGGTSSKPEDLAKRFRESRSRGLKSEFDDASDTEEPDAFPREVAKFFECSREAALDRDAWDAGYREGAKNRAASVAGYSEDAKDRAAGDGKKKGRRKGKKKKGKR